MAATRMRRRRQHRLLFAAAGAYNLTWGGWVAFTPTWLYHTVGVPEPTHPEIAACLGMVIGLYGIVYLEIARNPERGWLPAAVGLTGKLIGPAGLAVHIVLGTWPVTALTVIAFNDLIWWLPFAIYLHDAWPYYRTELHARPPPSSSLAHRVGPGRPERGPKTRATL